MILSTTSPALLAADESRTNNSSGWTCRSNSPADKKASIAAYSRVLLGAPTIAGDSSLSAPVRVLQRVTLGDARQQLLGLAIRRYSTH